LRSRLGALRYSQKLAVSIPDGIIDLILPALLWRWGLHGV